jgi:hypothetical protein
MPQSSPPAMVNATPLMPLAAPEYRKAAATALELHHITLSMNILLFK